MDVIDRIEDVLVENGVSIDKASNICVYLRNEYAGDMIYVPKRSSASKIAIFEDLKTNGNFRFLAKKHNVSVMTISRMYKKLRGLKK